MRSAAHRLSKPKASARWATVTRASGPAIGPICGNANPKRIKDSFHIRFIFNQSSQSPRIQGIVIPTVETPPRANLPGLESIAELSACTDRDRLSKSPAYHCRRLFPEKPFLVWLLSPERPLRSRSHFSPTVYIHAAPPDISFHCAQAY